MIDLSGISGLSVSLDSVSGQLALSDDLVAEGTGQRTIGELSDVLSAPESVADRNDDVAYWLYRGVHRPSNKSLLDGRGLRYDITVTLPGDIGGEFIKTAGHIHSAAPDGVGYPEIYDVLLGEAAFVIQFSEPLRVVIATCGAGERILIPPGASHLTVNVGHQPLVVADLVAIDSQNDYGDFRVRRGAAIHIVRHGDAWAERVNPAYPQRPIWYVLDGSRIGEFMPAPGSLYTDAIANPDRYRYLTAPAPRNPEMQALWSGPE